MGCRVSQELSWQLQRRESWTYIAHGTATAIRMVELEAWGGERVGEGAPDLWMTGGSPGGAERKAPGTPLQS